VLKQASGVQGVLRFGTVAAAKLHSWRLSESAPMVWELTASIAEVNRFYITQTPLSVTLRVGSRNWCWRDVVLEIVGSQVRCMVRGRPEVR
jgi:hypothetical protein